MNDDAQKAAEKALKNAQVTEAVKKAEANQPVIVVVNNADKDKDKKPRRGLHAFDNT